MVIDRSVVRRLKEQLPSGTKIVLDSMGDDPNPVESGTRGTVLWVDAIGTIHCEFENGRCLGLIYGEDRFHRIED